MAVVEDLLATYLGLFQFTLTEPSMGTGMQSEGALQRPRSVTERSSASFHLSFYRCTQVPLGIASCNPLAAQFLDY